MLVSKKKYNKLKEDYNRLVDTKNNWKDSYNQMQSNNVKLEQRIKRLEKEVKKYKYAKITKYAGGRYTDIDKRLGLEIGKTYKIVSYPTSLNDDCRIYLNEEHPSYFITEGQYELVDKEYPVATFKVDVKEVIQAKIDELRTDAEIIANEHKRMELQMFNLNSKANKLEEVIEIL